MRYYRVISSKRALYGTLIYGHIVRLSNCAATLGSESDFPALRGGAALGIVVVLAMCCIRVSAIYVIKDWVKAKVKRIAFDFLSVSEIEFGSDNAETVESLVNGTDDV